MARQRKRARGGGRKPQGEFDGLTAPFSLRMPQELREQLAAAAKKSRRSVGQEVVSRLTNSFGIDRNKERDPAVRAICFLLAELVDKIRWASGPYEWHTSPFLFRTVKIGFAKLLDAIEPKGELPPPPPMLSMAEDLKKRSKGTPLEKDATRAANEMAALWKTPQRVGAKAAENTISDLYHGAQSEIETLSRLLGFEENEQVRELATFGKARAERTHYGMSDVRRDLKLISKSSKGKA